MFRQAYSEKPPRSCGERLIRLHLVMPFAGECSPFAKARQLLALPGLIALFLCGGFAARGADLDAARQDFIQGHYSNCIHLCQQAIGEQEYNEEWRLLLIESMMTLGQYTNALSVLATNLDRYSSSLRLRLIGREVFSYNDQKEKADALLQEINTL